MEIYLVRHGETDWNSVHRLQGQSDVELNEKGRELAGITGRALEDTEFDVIYSSPLMRAFETANLIRGHRNIQIIRDDRLKELCFGDYEGGIVPELMANEADPFHYFFSAPEKYRAPKGGESLEALCARTAAFMKETFEAHEKEYKRVMIVAHAACNASIRCHVRGWGLDHFWDGKFQKNCCVSRIELTDRRYEMPEECRVYYEPRDKWT